METRSVHLPTGRVGPTFVGVGPDQQLEAVKKTLSDKYKIKVEQLGLEEGQSREVRILLIIL